MLTLWHLRCAIRWLQGWRPADEAPVGEWRLVWVDGATIPGIGYRDLDGVWRHDEDVEFPNVRWVKALPRNPYC